MIRTIALLGLVASASAFLGIFENKQWYHGLHTTFGKFFGVPRTSQAASRLNWVIMEKPIKSNPSGYDPLVLWADPKDPTRGILVDENGQTSGLQIAISGEGYYDMVEQGFTPWTIINAAGEKETLWTTSMYFASEDEATRKNSHNETLVVREDYVVVEGYYGKLMKISAYLDKVDSIWKKQACVPFMGDHYYYNMTTTLGCDKPFFTYFPLYDHKTGQLIGLGIMLIRKHKETDSKYLECPTTAAVKYILRTCPKCLLDLVDECGATTIHIYLVDQPRLIICY